MSNMSYCRFENTSRDLSDCVSALRDMSAEDMLELNEYETAGLKSILHNARHLADRMDDGFFEGFFDE